MESVVSPSCAFLSFSAFLNKSPKNRDMHAACIYIAQKVPSQNNDYIANTILVHHHIANQFASTNLSSWGKKGRRVWME